MQPYKYGTMRLVAVPRVLVTLGLCLSMAFSLEAKATLTTVTTTLESPNGIVSDATPIHLVDTISVGAGAEINSTPTSSGPNIGTSMLDVEFIKFLGSSITVRAGCGDNPSNGFCMTGYGSGAKYIFSDLVDTMGAITGFHLRDISGFQNFDLNSVSFNSTDHTLSVALDTMHILDIINTGASLLFGELTIDLLTAPDVQPPVNDIPEPNSLALALVAALALAGVARNRKA